MCRGSVLICGLCADRAPGADIVGWVIAVIVILVTGAAMVFDAVVNMVGRGRTVKLDDNRPADETERVLRSWWDRTRHGSLGPPGGAPVAVKVSSDSDWVEREVNGPIARARLLTVKELEQRNLDILEEIDRLTVEVSQ